VPFSVANCRRFAAYALSQPPPEHVERVEPIGLRVASYVLPLELCPALNAFAEMEGWRRHKLKKQVLLIMQAQHDRRLPMIPGKPWARAIRFSSRAADEQSGWSKLPVDRLTPKHGGLGLIEDDRISKLKLCCWWEPAPPGSGFVLLDVFTGKATT
jgi:hypothetical protein